MARWMRFKTSDDAGFGVLDGETVIVHEGDMFAAASPTGRTIARSSVDLALPCVPGKMICLWNNSRALAERAKLNAPSTPFYFLKAGSSYLPGEQEIPRPASYGGRVLYEGELGIVIGRRCANIGEAEAATHIFGYTCINDVTAIDILHADPAFAQWTRAKGFDGFGVIGPVIATGLDPAGLRIRTLLDGRERQNYAVSDMFFEPYRLISLISQDMTLNPGDIIACGTSVGALPMKPGSQVEVVIDGIGTLSSVMG